MYFDKSERMTDLCSFTRATIHTSDQPGPPSPSVGEHSHTAKVVEFLNYRKKYRSLQKSKPGRNVRKEMLDPFPPRGDVRPTKSESRLRLCNKEPIKKGMSLK